MELLFLVVIVVGLILYSIVSSNRDRRKTMAVFESNSQIKNEELLEKSKRLILMGEVLRQSKLVGDTETYEKAVDMTYDGRMPEKVGGYYTSLYDNLLIMPIAGINYRGNLKAYVGNFKGVLVPEPKNEYDENAIMVKCEDGHHLGYVPEEMTGTVRDMIGCDFKKHRITGDIQECEDDDGRNFFVGTIYVVG